MFRCDPFYAWPQTKAEEMIWLQEATGYHVKKDINTIEGKSLREGKDTARKCGIGLRIEPQPEVISAWKEVIRRASWSEPWAQAMASSPHTEQYGIIYTKYMEIRAFDQE